jgi:tripartite-type tricarboxylate transporter receptor subunit TctC
MTAYAKANPNKLNYASNGNGSSAHVATVLYESMAGVDMAHIPYKGLAPAMTDLMSGQVQLMFSSMVAIVPQINNGKFRALAVTSAKRSPLLPNVPTLAESGLVGYEAGSWYGLLAPAGTPPDIIRKINQESAKALRQTSVRDSLTGEGAEVVGGTPEDFARHIKVEHTRIGKMIADGRLKMN